MDMTMDELTRAMRDEARRLLEAGEVDVVIGFTSGTLPLRAAPAFVRRVEDVDRLIWNSLCENNLARYLRGHREQRVAVFAKGCDSRAIVALLTEKQLDRDKLHIIGVPCRGMVDRRLLTRQAPGEVLAWREEGDEVIVEGEGFALRLHRSEALYPSCAVCAHPNPVIYDVLLGQEVEVWTQDPYGHVREIEAMSAAERSAYFAAEAARCIRCYACRQACPMCYCEECFVDHSNPRWIESGATPAGLQGWQIGRAYHLTGRCVACGACSRACPTEIDLVYLNGKLRQEVWTMYGFEPGLQVDELPPLALFQPEEDAQPAG